MVRTAWTAEALPWHFGALAGASVPDEMVEALDEHDDALRFDGGRGHSRGLAVRGIPAVCAPGYGSYEILCMALCTSSIWPSIRAGLICSSIQRRTRRLRCESQDVTRESSLRTPSDHGETR